MTVRSKYRPLVPFFWTNNRFSAIVLTTNPTLDSSGKTQNKNKIAEASCEEKKDSVYYNHSLMFPKKREEASK
jgi:hypothetical protein